MSEDDATNSSPQLTSPAPLFEDDESSAEEIPYKNAPANGADEADEADEAGDDESEDDDDDAPDECVRRALTKLPHTDTIPDT